MAFMFSEIGGFECTKFPYFYQSTQANPTLFDEVDCPVPPNKFWAIEWPYERKPWAQLAIDIYSTEQIGMCRHFGLHSSFH
jgi:hypothetical protein